MPIVHALRGRLPALKPGQRFSWPLPAGSADALLLAELCLPDAGAGASPWLVVTASAADAQRLQDELRWFVPELRVGQLPDWETLPYDGFSPHQDLISERLATLWAIRGGALDVVIAPANTAIQRLAPADFLAAYTFDFRQGEALDEAALRAQLVLAGYNHVSQVMAPGEYAVRGGLIDLHPMGSPVPYRVDLFGDTIDSIHAFDPDSQRSLYPVREVRLLPGREFPIDEAAQKHFRARWREVFEGDPSRSPLYKDMGNGVAGPGIEYYLPLFFDRTATLLDYVGARAQVVLHGDVAAAIRKFWTDTQDRYRLLRHDPERPALPPEQLFLTEEAFFTAIGPLPQLALRNAGDDAGAPSAALPDLTVDRRATRPLDRLAGWLDAGRSTGRRTLLVAESAGRRETLRELLQESGLAAQQVETWDEFATGDAPFALTVAPLARGFTLPPDGLAVVTETELFALSPGQRRRRKQEQTSNVDTLIQDLSELKPGDPVVHANHGIGRYQGLVHLDLGDGPAEFLHLVYANDAALYVPVSQLHLIGRYSGAAADDAPLHTLGSGQWDKARRKAAEQIRDTAAELLNIYARRAAREGHAFRFPQHDYEAFAASFGFEETPDQAAAIHAVIQDMISPRPMDRLVCGDVGFGKTEVALRAAFAAAINGVQVAVVVPTTLLARQHFKNFSARFAGLPVRIAQMSRMASAADMRTARSGLADGSIDIVIGTHAVLGKTVNFKNLGLVVIDEEQHFGVGHKERLKELRAEVHVLTLSATPIPRTLQLALTGVRELSIIATPPVDRLAVRTFVTPFDDLILREALLRERFRGGQSFFVCPRLEDLDDATAWLRQNVPEAKFTIAHGQMAATELEERVGAFYDGKYDVLVSTNIVESGLDIPTANTLIVYRADMFGLAQLYQLRGRVGRSKTRAYAFFTTPVNRTITPQAQKRLEVLQSLDTLGAGFQLASHDLDLRGAGNLLGDEQSGHIREVGYELYQQMLNETIAALKAGGGEAVEETWSPLITLGTPVTIPEHYVEDLDLRLQLYRRLATLDDEAEIESFAAEMIDRFGPMPDEVNQLMVLVGVKALCRHAHVEKVEAGPKGIIVGFRNNSFANPAGLVRYIAKQGSDAKVRPDMKIVFIGDFERAKDRLDGARKILRDLVQIAEKKG